MRFGTLKFDAFDASTFSKGLISWRMNAVTAVFHGKQNTDWEMAVNCQLKPGAKHNRYELLAWLNASLHTRFTKVEQTCSGAAFCQMMDWLFPDSVDLSQVQFLPRHEEDSLQNYSVLQAAFKKTGVVQSIPVKELVQGRLDTALDFLIWFKAFFDANNRARDYNALEARGGQSMVPRTPTSTPDASPMPTTRARTQLTPNASEAAEHPWQRSKDTSALSRPPIKRQIKVETEQEPEAKVENDERTNMELKVDGEITEESGDPGEDEKMADEKVEQTESGFKMETGERTGGEVEKEGKRTMKEGETVEGGRKEQNLEIWVSTNIHEKKSKRGEKDKEDEKTEREEDERKEGKRTEKEEDKMTEEDKRTEGNMTEKEEDGRTKGEEDTRKEGEEDEMED
ncbi:microtubule-associated protein RP/EB family member 3-like [Hypomesus transpacificus]|uniref:microtubule-associated protein RP/EB family member 3-like n=1 Tax=Hypomesus transpacificus TaxID=137520 RepID=UPI001F078870|nr:microtubule-associated protein RP/EB family member 3-like [Hypomesus transpacificus]